MTDRVSMLGLRVLMRAGWSRDRPAVEAFLGGRRLGEGTDYDDFAGHGPHQLLADDQALWPDSQSRVSLLCCGCGEWGCGEIAPLVEVDGALVRWTDFRLYLGASLRSDGPDNPTRGQPLSWPDLTFDAEQYRAEIERAAADRTWEPEGMAVAKLLRQRLDA